MESRQRKAPSTSNNAVNNDGDDDGDEYMGDEDEQQDDSGSSNARSNNDRVLNIQEKVPWDRMVTLVTTAIVHNNDVLGGRAKKTKNHPGNIYYRELIKKSYQAYQATTNREEKGQITNRVIHCIHNTGGRFLRPPKKGQSVDFAESSSATGGSAAATTTTTSGFWIVLDGDAQWDKVTNALRSERDPQRNNAESRAPSSLPNAGQRAKEAETMSEEDEEVKRFHERQLEILQSLQGNENTDGEMGTSEST